MHIRGHRFCSAVIVEASTHGDAIVFAKMTMVDKVDSATIDYLVKTNVRVNQPVKTDDLPVYTILLAKMDIITCKKSL